MNGNRTIHIVRHIGTFCARHFFALAVTVTMGCLLWTVVYFALLLWAAFTGNGLGGPLAYPAGLFFFLIAGTATSLFLLFPSTVFAEWFANRLGFPVLAQIPLSVASLAILSLAVVTTTSTISHPTFWSAFVGFGVLFLSLLLPLGFYWWVAQSGPLISSVLQRFRTVL